VEQEYFIQLFVEPDNTQNVATVGDLLRKMFKEQNICFTKVQAPMCVESTCMIFRKSGSFAIKIFS
jgi:hypothetical protein